MTWGAFVLAFVFGAVGNKTNFCTMGAVSDWVNMGDTSRMRMWLLAIAVALIGAAGLVGLAAFGLFQAARSAEETARLEAGRTATVILISAATRSSSSVISTSQTQVVRPRWRGLAVALTWPSVIGRRKVALFDWPIATIPRPRTSSQVEPEQTLSAIAA